MVWLLIDLKEKSCYYFSIGLIFTDFLSMWSLFGISALRLIAVVKKNFFINLDQLEDVLWKFMFPIFLAIVVTLMFTIFESVIEDLEDILTWRTSVDTLLWKLLLYSLEFSRQP